jgi:3-phosphoinositide dependent protein kinase-1
MLRLEDQAKNNEYHRFVEGHLIVKQGILYKKKGFFPKKRMFLLTEGPHLYYVDPDKMVLKGEIPWSSKLRTEIRDFRVFFVHVPGRTYYLVSDLKRSRCVIISLFR